MQFYIFGHILKTTKNTKITLNIVLVMVKKSSLVDVESLKIICCHLSYIREAVILELCYLTTNVKKICECSQHLIRIPVFKRLNKKSFQSNRFS